MSTNRRSFLQYGAAAVAAAVAAARSTAFAAQAVMQGRRIVRQAAPENLETDFGNLADFITPTDEHYVRSHFAVPQVDAATWALDVKGLVARPFTLSLDQLRALPAVTRVVTLECAGNGRSFLSPAVSGVQWARGAVSTAEWTGVRLADLLDTAGLAAGATRLVFEGHDRGEVKNVPFPAGPITFHRSLSIEEARARDVFVAYAIGGRPVPAGNGAPVRLIVPGCYGMASVKWLRGIEAVAGDFNGYWETTDYAYWDRTGTRPLRQPLLGMQVKSLIARPSAGGRVARGTSVELAGAAWSDGPVTRIEVSTDGGRTWRDGVFVDSATDWAWRRWRFPWKVPADAGEAVLMSRATDAKGRTQPMTRNTDYGSYAIHHVVPMPVTIG